MGSLKRMRIIEAEAGERIDLYACRLWNEAFLLGETVMGTFNDVSIIFAPQFKRTPKDESNVVELK